eukprot:4496401-Lingulodinium_polyedra.AAC.1
MCKEQRRPGGHTTAFHLAPANQAMQLGTSGHQAAKRQWVAQRWNRLQPGLSGVGWQWRGADRD